MKTSKQKELLAKLVNVSQIIEGKDGQTYIVLKSHVDSTSGPSYSIYPKDNQCKNKNQ